MTNDERREVAAKLRDMAVRTNPSWPALMEALGTPGRSVTVQYLADLIEPEGRTCERGIEMFSHAYPNEIVCDSDCVSTYVFPLTCGHEVELLENKWPSYCPHCGARVVADD